MTLGALLRGMPLRGLAQAYPPLRERLVTPAALGAAARQNFCASTRSKFSFLRLDVCATRRDGPDLEPFNGPDTVSSFIHRAFPEVVGDVREHVVAIATDSRHKPLAIWHVSQGTANASMAAPAEVFRPAMLVGASAVLIAHNHPSGDATPSQSDVELTRVLVDAGRLHTIPLLDHVIVTREGAYTSLRAKGLIA